MYVFRFNFIYRLDIISAVLGELMQMNVFFPYLLEIYYYAINYFRIKRSGFLLLNAETWVSMFCNIHSLAYNTRHTN